MSAVVRQGLLTGATLAIVLACAPASSDQVLTPPPVSATAAAHDASPTASAPASGGGTTTARPVPATAPAPDATPSASASVPTEPRESLPVPRTLDRDFEDTEQTRRSRENLVAVYVEPNVRDERVLAAMRAVPRHSFIPTGQLGDAYADHPLPIEAGQTISQPSLVAQMTAILELDEGDRVLEIGTGSGYQAAILAQLTDEVYSVEIIPELAGIARAVLDRLGAPQVDILRADGYFGWAEHAPYDAIIVTAAPDHLPSPLVQQLKDGGRMVIPIGPVGDIQTLWLVTRDGGETRMEDLGGVRFVPFTREDRD